MDGFRACQSESRRRCLCFAKVRFRALLILPVQGGSKHR